MSNNVSVDFTWRQDAENILSPIIKDSYDYPHDTSWAHEVVKHALAYMYFVRDSNMEWAIALLEQKGFDVCFHWDTRDLTVYDTVG